MSAETAPNSQQYLRRAEASAYVEAKYNQPCAKATLATMAVRGEGPPFYKAGSTPLYLVADLDRWALERLGRSVRSTSELRQTVREQEPARPFMLTREPGSA
jgi:hypothetical protein